MDDLRLDPVGDQVMSCMSCWTRGGERRGGLKLWSGKIIVEKGAGRGKEGGRGKLSVTSVREGMVSKLITD